MENMDKELTVPKWVLIVRPKITQMPSKIFSPKCLPKTKSPRFFFKNLSLGVLSPCTYAITAAVRNQRQQQIKVVWSLYFADWRLKWEPFPYFHGVWSHVKSSKASLAAIFTCSILPLFFQKHASEVLKHNWTPMQSLTYCSLCVTQ